MKKVSITLTLNEVQELYQLVRESSHTGDLDWDDTMQSIEEKIRKKINQVT